MIRKRKISRDDIFRGDIETDALFFGERMIPYIKMAYKVQHNAMKEVENFRTPEERLAFIKGVGFAMVTIAPEMFLIARNIQDGKEN